MKKTARLRKSRPALAFFAGGGTLLVLSAVILPYALSSTYIKSDGSTIEHGIFERVKEPPKLDVKKYNERMLALAHIDSAKTTTDTSTTTPEGITLIRAGTATTSVSVPGELWPVATPYPKYGAILPEHRIIAYYGNFYSKGMGVLGEYPEEVVLSKLAAEKAAWETADPTTTVIPAIDYIAVTAQGSAGRDGLYRLQMPDSQIDYALELAQKAGGIVILEIQVGLSTLQAELPALEKYLSLPNVHLAIDPEFSMKHNEPPGSVIGTFSSADINYAIDYLAQLTREHDLPPKVLIIHRFTQKMVTGYSSIRPAPEVQVVMVMDGWGFAAKKINTFNSVINPEPVQFSGFKIFYKNDLKPPSTRLLTPAEVLELTPSPSFIQYQ